MEQHGPPRRHPPSLKAWNWQCTPYECLTETVWDSEVILAWLGWPGNNVGCCYTFTFRCHSMEEPGISKGAGTKSCQGKCLSRSCEGQQEIQYCSNDDFTGCAYLCWFHQVCLKRNNFSRGEVLWRSGYKLAPLLNNTLLNSDLIYVYIIYVHALRKGLQLCVDT